MSFNFEQNYILQEEQVDISMRCNGIKYRNPIMMSSNPCVSTVQMIDLFIEKKMLPVIHNEFESFEFQHDYLYLGLGQLELLRKKKIDFKDYEARKQHRKEMLFEFEEKLNQKIFKKIQNVYFTVFENDWRNNINFLNENGYHKFYLKFEDFEQMKKAKRYIEEKDKEAKIIVYCEFRNDILNKIQFNKNQLLVLNFNDILYKETGVKFDIKKIINTYKDTEVCLYIQIDSFSDMSKYIFQGAKMLDICKELSATNYSAGVYLNKKYQIIRESDIVFDKVSREKQVFFPYQKGYYKSVNEIDRQKFQKYYGKTIEFINDIESIFMKTLSYTGCKNWKQFKKKANVCQDEK